MKNRFANFTVDLLFLALITLLSLYSIKTNMSILIHLGCLAIILVVSIALTLWVGNTDNDETEDNEGDPRGQG